MKMGSYYVILDDLEFTIVDQASHRLMDPAAFKILGLKDIIPIKKGAILMKVS